MLNPISEWVEHLLDFGMQPTSDLLILALSGVVPEFQRSTGNPFSLTSA
jgi:hypothetical protein